MAYQTPPQLAPEDLFQEQARLDEARLVVYNRILAAIHKKIKHTSSLQNSNQMTYYDFQEWQPGCPRFDVKDCILYIVWNLRNSGFKVLYVSPNRIIINWKDQSVQYYQEDSPIRQAMLATAQQKNPPPLPPPMPATGKEKKKAGSYRPPAEGILGLLQGGNGASKKSGSTITFI